MKKILIISYAFPPQNIVGANRTFRFCKYLPDLGWKPYVFARNICNTAPVDSNLKLDSTNLTKVFRFRDMYLNTWKNWPIFGSIISAFLKRVLIPDEMVLWNIPLFFKTLYLFSTNKIDMVLCSVPPFSSFLGSIVIAKLLRIPFVADFRDLWTLNEYFERESNLFRKNIERLMEKFIISNSTIIILNTPNAMDMMSDKYQNYRHKFRVITNGYDKDDFEDFRPTKFGKFTITHTGSFYGDRNPDAFLRGFRYWLDHYQLHDIQDKCQLLFVGRNCRHSERLARDLRLNTYIRYIEQLPRSGSYKILSGAHLLLLCLGFDKNSRYVVPAKLYDYLGVRRQILAMVPEGQASNIIIHMKAGKIVSKDNAELIAEHIDNYFKVYERGDYEDEYSGTDSSMFQWHNLCKKLSDILDEATNHTYQSKRN